MRASLLARVVPAVLLLALLPGPAAAAEPCRVHGAIGDHWTSVGADQSFLGPCLTGELPVAGGVVQQFRGGSVYWSPGTGARSVHGAIRGMYDAVGGPASRLWLPTTSETPTPYRFGAFNHFAGGSIYWSPATGARLVIGAIRERWAAQGWENGTLGFPVTDEYRVDGGARSDFSGGSITWDARTGATTVLPGPRPSFTFTVQPVVAGDLPATYRSGCPVSPQDLRLIRLSHRDFAGANRTGELVVHADQVPRLLKVFARLHEGRFPIARMVRVDVFGGSDGASMDANNTSAFNCRRVTGGTDWSEHAYGRAVDINPVQNPYVSGSTVLPTAGRAYLDRGNRRPGMIGSGDPVVQSFAAEQWAWGGAWSSSRDYQHFSRSGR